MGRRAVVREVLAARELRAFWAGELLSVAGDQLARVGLAVLVYRETSSAAWTALAFALTFLPSLLGGALFRRLSHRLPRREVVVAGHLARVAVAGLLAASLPVPVLLGLAGVLGLAGGPARAALPDIPAHVMRKVATLAAHVAGLLAGGALLVLAGPPVALGLCAVTFATAAAVVLLGVRHRPAE
ncbi:MAG: MFS transporter, partial [Actinophytocola sp.]